MTSHRKTREARRTDAGIAWHVDWTGIRGVETSPSATVAGDLKRKLLAQTLRARFRELTLRPALTILVTSLHARVVTRREKIATITMRQIAEANNHEHSTHENTQQDVPQFK
jgi:hypothetical protein